MIIYYLSPISLATGIMLLVVFYEYQSFNAAIVIGTILMEGGLVGSLRLLLHKKK